MSMWQVGLYKHSGDKTVLWKNVDAKSRDAAIKQADLWVQSMHIEKHPWSMVFVARESAVHVSALRYLDESEWYASGKGLAIDLKHKRID